MNFISSFVRDNFKKVLLISFSLVVTSSFSQKNEGLSQYNDTLELKDDQIIEFDLLKEYFENEEYSYQSKVLFLGVDTLVIKFRNPYLNSYSVISFSQRENYFYKKLIKYKESRKHKKIGSLSNEPYVIELIENEYLKLYYMLDAQQLNFENVKVDSFQVLLLQLQDTLSELGVESAEFVHSDYLLSNFVNSDDESIATLEGEICPEGKVVDVIKKSDIDHLLAQLISKDNFYEYDPAWCTFMPHDGYFFCDKNKKVIALLEICYLCSEARLTIFPRKNYVSEEYFFLFYANKKIKVKSLRKKNKSYLRQEQADELKELRIKKKIVKMKFKW